jgi:hydroxymethylbilane synthase
MGYNFLLMNMIRIGTRGSRLALWQARYVEGELRKHAPQIACELLVIKTQGDRDQNSSLTRIGGLGVFTKEIEKALLNDEIDIAIHSLKDLPSTLSDGLVLGAVPARGPVEDALVSLHGVPLQALPKGATIGTGSIRRRSQLLHHRPDLLMTDLRGNIDTRLRKLQMGEFDAIVMAWAALVRLEMKNISYSVFESSELIPAVGQGAIGVQIREGDRFIEDFIRPLNHDPTYQAVTAERAFLSRLESGCQFPVGATAQVGEDRIEIAGFVGSEDGQTIYRDSKNGSNKAPTEIGIQLAERFIELGALALLDEYRDGDTST